RALAQLGCRHFACCAHVHPKHPPRGAVVFHDYPNAWAGSYADRDLHKSDPVFQRAERDSLPFRRRAPDFRAGLTPLQRQILQEAASLGIAGGYTVPVHLPWAVGALRASCSVIPDASSIDERAFRAVQVMATYLYATVARHAASMATREHAGD